MSQANLSPRQKMINMMYIVLTALLALNISAQVLDAFVYLDKSIEHSIQIVAKKNAAALADFEREAIENEAKAGDYFRQAQQVAEETQKLYQYIQELKIELVLMGDGKKTKAITEDNKVNPEGIDALGGTDASNRVMIGSQKNNGKAFELRARLKAYSERVRSFIDPQRGTAVINSIEELLKAEDGYSKNKEYRSWEVSKFEGVPLIAALTNLSKLQLDIYNSETEVISFLAREVTASDFKFSDIEVAVIPSSNFVVKGSEYTAEIFLAAYDPTQRPVLRIGEQTLNANEKGKIVYKTSPQEIGQKAVSGEVWITTVEGPKSFPVQFKYTVVNPNTVISPTRMNVLYRGIENPVSISASGASHERMEVSMTNANWSRQGDTYIVKPGDGRTCEISVKVDGKQLDKPQSFRVKDLPLPMPMLDGLTSKLATKGELQASMGVKAEMPRDFEFDLKYRVTSFRVFASIDGYAEDEVSQSNTFTDKQKKIFDRLRSGQRVIFTEIKAIGPDGKTVELFDTSVKIR
ncbi:MAG: gliding motility protein GldM [Prevotellaceae bacterium]|jgi:gliding motility-associated protein GldM|nr:gliding motility protein GldM [Prevotellaceae bacterium]